MELTQYKALIAIACVDIPQELLKDILVPVVGLSDTDNYWHQATAHLALAIARHQVGMGDMRAECLQATLAAVTVENVLNSLSFEQHDYYARMPSKQLSAILACLRPLVGTSKSYPMAA